LKVASSDRSERREVFEAHCYLPFSLRAKKGALPKDALQVIDARLWSKLDLPGQDRLP